MEYVQDRITTLHDFTGRIPDAPIEHTAIVVPMTERDHAVLATEQLLVELERLDPARVVVALRADENRVSEFHGWLQKFDLPLTVLWCGGDSLAELLDSFDLDGSAGKGRDIWLAIGVAAEQSPFVVCHDADTKTFEAADIARLVFPLGRDYSFSKGYYARIEDGRLYGRLFRLFFVPLVRCLLRDHSAPILEYLDSFRYALSGEFGLTADLARRLRFERRFGLEVGMLGDVFDHAGFSGTAQVDLGRYEHDHRAVGGPTGLVDMSADVSAAFFRAVEDHGVTPSYSSLPGSFIEQARTLITQYDADASFNGMEYNASEEVAQIEEYAEVIRPPPPRAQLPAWEHTDLDPSTVLERANADLGQVL